MNEKMRGITTICDIQCSRWNANDCFEYTMNANVMAMAIMGVEKQRVSGSWRERTKGWRTKKWNENPTDRGNISEWKQQHSAFNARMHSARDEYCKWCTWISKCCCWVSSHPLHTERFMQLFLSISIAWK